MNNSYGTSSIGTESTNLTARKCAGKMTYDGSDCGSPIHPNHIWCWKHRLEESDKVLDAYLSGDLLAEDAKEQWIRAAKNWDNNA